MTPGSKIQYVLVNVLRKLTHLLYVVNKHLIGIHAFVYPIDNKSVYTLGKCDFVWIF